MRNVVDKRFQPDEHTVVLYHFDEGQGDVAHDACGDSALTLRASQPLWGQSPDGRPVARFTRRDDDANVFVGPLNNDKLHLRTCRDAWTIEAWLRYTGPQGDDLGRTYANICSTDDEGFTQPRGPRGGWLFALHTAQQAEGLMPWGRFIGATGRSNSNVMTGSGITPVSEGYEGESPVTICDQEWHHVAWQFRFRDQQHSLFIDGQLVWVFNRPSGRVLINDVARTCIPFVVGGLLHQQKPPYYPGYGGWEGEICELRISDVLRYSTSDHLSILRKEPAPAACNMPYEFVLEAEAAKGKVTWDIAAGRLPAGLTLDADRGVIYGKPADPALPVTCTISATDESGAADQYAITMETKSGEIATESLPLAFTDKVYRQELNADYLATPLTWSVCEGSLPQGYSLDADSGVIEGTGGEVACSRFVVKATDANGQSATRELTLKVAPADIEDIGPDEHTVVLYDWQGPDGKFIPDVMGDEDLELTWTNMMGDIRVPGRLGRRYPITPGGGEWGFVGPQHNDKLNLRTCQEAWTVEAWVRRGGSVNHYGQPFDFGHICGTYDNTHQGVWELYLAYDGSPDGGMSPGAHFLGAKPEHVLIDLHPWKRREGVVADKEQLAIHDTQWHHVAWQYCYETDTHELFLDGVLIWRLASPDGKRVVNDRTHDAQFSVGTRLNGYARYGGKFNWLGWGNFYGQIGEIRISNVRRYEG